MKEQINRFVPSGNSYETYKEMGSPATLLFKSPGRNLPPNHQRLGPLIEKQTKCLLSIWRAPVISLRKPF
jgi:hypothetical protein